MSVCVGGGGGGGCVPGCKRFLVNLYYHKNIRATEWRQAVIRHIQTDGMLVFGIQKASRV